MSNTGLGQRERTVLWIGRYATSDRRYPKQQLETVIDHVTTHGVAREIAREIPGGLGKFIRCIRREIGTCWPCRLSWLYCLAKTFCWRGLISRPCYCVIVVILFHFQLHRWTNFQGRAYRRVPVYSMFCVAVQLELEHRIAPRYLGIFCSGTCTNPCANPRTRPHQRVTDPCWKFLGIKPELLDWRGMNSYPPVVEKSHFTIFVPPSPEKDFPRQWVWSSTYLRVLGWRLRTVSSHASCCLEFHSKGTTNHSMVHSRHRVLAREPHRHHPVHLHCPRDIARVLAPYTG